MNKSDLIREYAGRAGISIKEAGEKLDILQDIILENIVEGKKITLLNLGKLEVRETKARKGRNPRTGEEIQIEAGNKLAYIASKLVKETVNR